MELIYQGGIDAVHVPLPDGRDPELAHGDSFDFPDEFAARLLEQPENWRRAEPEVPLDERIAKAKSHADLDAIADELGVAFSDDVTTAAAKKAVLVEAAATAPTSDEPDSNDEAGSAGEEQ